MSPSATDRPGGRLRLRLPVGVALGLVLSLLLIVMCSIIIFYMSASDRRIAGRLLEETGHLMVARQTQTITRFFDHQEQLVKALAAAMPSGDAVPADPGAVLLENASLRVGAGDDAPASGWTGPEFDQQSKQTIMRYASALPDGRVLNAIYPMSVFRSLLPDLTWRDDQVPFILVDQTGVLLDAGWEAKDVKVSSGAPLPALADLPTERPLRNIWTDDPSVHQIPGKLDGHVFPHGDPGRYAAIYTTIDDGPAKGWIVGSLFRAQDFGTAIDQSRVVLIASVIALGVGVILAFLLGRWLGKPLDRLAKASAAVRDLDFEHVQRLPSSPLAELDEVNASFNGTLTALTAFARYVPQQLVKKLIAEGMADPGQIESREMTIVFTDLAGFTSVASHLTAEETARFLNHHFETVSDAISAQAGTIDKYIGDGVMAFWGAPAQQPDHAELAVAAVRALAARIEELHEPDIRLRIGIHTGRVVVGNIGSSTRMNYTVIGDPVNVAARLQEYGKTVAPDARVIALASAETVAGLRDPSIAREVEEVALRGRSEGTKIFRIV